MFAPLKPAFRHYLLRGFWGRLFPLFIQGTGRSPCDGVMKKWQGSRAMSVFTGSQYVHGYLFLFSSREWCIFFHCFFLVSLVFLDMNAYDKGLHPYGFLTYKLFFSLQTTQRNGSENARILIWHCLAVLRIDFCHESKNDISNDFTQSRRLGSIDIFSNSHETTLTKFAILH